MPHPLIPVPITEDWKTLHGLREMWKAQKERGVPARRKKLVDVCIPAYKEEGYVEKTVEDLMQQTMWVDNTMNIVVGEFSQNPDHLSGKKTSYLKELCHKNGIFHVFVPGKGVGYARNHTIHNGSISDIICNMDADSRFNRSDAVWRLVEPLLDPTSRTVLTCCETVVVDSAGNDMTLSERAYRTLLFNASRFERYAPVSRSLGMTFRRPVFYRINGFPLINLGEDYTFNLRVVSTYGLFSRKFIPEVKVLSSDRRAKAMSVHGVGVLDYDKSYR